MKLQDEVEGRETVDDRPLQLLVWVTDSSKIMHSANHFLSRKLHRSLGPKRVLITEC